MPFEHIDRALTLKTLSQALSGPPRGLTDNFFEDLIYSGAMARNELSYWTVEHDGEPTWVMGLGE